ncbi:MAG: fibronectin type III domain-containing protein, partial [Candidatus Heimdallarchaeaceae archaeon]
MSGTARIEWREAKDSFGKDIIYDVYYSRDKGISWNLLSEGAVVPLLLWDTTTVEDGENYLIKVVAQTEDGLMAEDMSDKPFEIKNNEDTETGTTTITFDLP